MGIEDWWGRKVEKRGSVNLTNMPDSSVATIRKLSIESILELIRSEDTRSVRGLSAHMELRRREQWTARVALVISIVALSVGMIGLGANL